MSKVYIPLILLALYMAVYSIGYTIVEFEKKPIMHDKLSDASYLYDFYISGNPSIEERGFIGLESAKITMIIYLDTSSASTDAFMQELYPILKQEYIDTGAARLYFKNIITVDDIKDRSENYIEAMQVFCLMKAQPEEFGAYFRDADSLPEIASCISGEAPALVEDASEVEQFGISLSPRIYIGIEGKDNTVLEGIPNPALLRRTIKNYQILLGE